MKRQSDITITGKLVKIENAGRLCDKPSLWHYLGDDEPPPVYVATGDVVLVLRELTTASGTDFVRVITDTGVVGWLPSSCVVKNKSKDIV